MRRLLAVLIMGIITLNSQAQNSAVNKAESAMKAENLAEAKEIITPALEHEKTFDKGRTWYINGMIYKGIALSADPNVHSIDKDALQKAVDSFKKVMELEKEGSTYHFFADEAMNQMWNETINKGATAYENDSMDLALIHFLNAKMIKPTDTTSILYTGVAAQFVGNWDLALENYKALGELGYIKEDVYGSMFHIIRYAKKDNEAAFEILKEAIQQFPDNENFKSTEIEMLIVMDKIDDAKKKLEETIAENPTDPVLYFSLGYMYDESGETEKAKANYAKAVELKPDYYEPNINLAILNYNEAIEVYKELNNLSMADYKKRGSTLEAKAQQLLRNSLPYWEAAHLSRPDQRAAIENLQNVYARLKMFEKSEEMRKKLEALDNNN
jgi:tetratricopeptide (TPR) repeat protein